MTGTTKIRQDFLNAAITQDVELIRTVAADSIISIEVINPAKHRGVNIDYIATRGNEEQYGTMKIRFKNASNYTLQEVDVYGDDCGVSFSLIASGTNYSVVVAADDSNGTNVEIQFKINYINKLI